MGETEQRAPKVVIFGAGITGLTVAHELVERGWDVVVVEKEIDPLNADEVAIGGLAKTQWAAYQARYAPESGPAEARPMVPTVRLRMHDGKGKREVITKLEALGLKDESTPADFAQAGGDALKDPLNELRKTLDVGSKLYLERLQARLVSIRPFVPNLMVHFPQHIEREGPTDSRRTRWCERGDRAIALLIAYLVGKTCDAEDTQVDVPLKDAPDDTLPPSTWQIETDLSDAKDGPFPRRAQSGILPGEHGFRFFPAFYRHVFDTLRRIPVRGIGQTFGDSYRTVFDNLIPTESNWLAIEHADPRPSSETGEKKGLLRFPRRLRKSLREVFDAMMEMQTQLGYTARDIELLKLRLFKYMTSCRERRKRDFEGLTWHEFMGLSDLSEACKRDMERAPQILAAMTAGESDARTQGNVATQLLLDPINADERVDSTLNAPTTHAWFAPWKDYLLSQEVKFIPGKLVGFESAPVGSPDKILPRVATDLQFKEDLANADYYVLALPIQSWSERRRGEGEASTTKSLVMQWGESRQQCAGAVQEDHIDRLDRWIEKHVKPSDEGNNFGRLFKGLSGVQLYFDSDNLARSGHTLYMDSHWRLSAISQASFWNRRREPFDGYRGIVSVDIGLLKDQSENSFWDTPRDLVHEHVWKQIDPGPAYEEDPAGGPPYRTYRLDEYIVYHKLDGKILPKENRAPFLINGVGEWQDRPGWAFVDAGEETGKEPDHVAVERRSPARYQLLPRYEDEARAANLPRWVLAGTFMQTWTRATTMESANESARHAVNTLLAHASKNPSFPRQGEPCRIWNPEEYEHPDLRIWKELDAKLYHWDRESNEPLPHMIDILDLEALPGAFLEGVEPLVIVEEAIRRAKASHGDSK